MDKEIWKDIEGYEGKYQVSNLGRVKSLLDSHGNLLEFEKILKSRKTKDGYLTVALFKNCKRKDYKIHRLVALSFIPKKDTVNHIDGNKENNAVSNLEWADRHEQLEHAYKLNLKKPICGDKNKNSKLTAEQVKEIKANYIRHSKEYGTVALAKKYGVSNCVIGLIVRGKTYKNV